MLTQAMSKMDINHEQQCLGAHLTSNSYIGNHVAGSHQESHGHAFMSSDSDSKPNRKIAHIASLPDMDDGQYAQWIKLLEQRTGMRLANNRKSFLVTNLGMRMRKLGINDYQQYFELIHDGHTGTVEWSQLVHHLTVHETRFLRHTSSLDLISQCYLPEIVNRSNNKPATISAWSVGCSSGEEPYSMAMAIDDYMNKINREYYLGIIASDISRSALAVGRKGIYTERQIKEISPKWRKKYFTATKDGKYEVAAVLKQRICFNQLNIVDMGNTPIGSMDIIICQNVLIYYDRTRREQIVTSLVDYLAPGGILILAVGELLNWSHPELERFHFADTLAYRHK